MADIILKRAVVLPHGTYFLKRMIVLPHKISVFLQHGWYFYRGWLSCHMVDTYKQECWFASLMIHLKRKVVFEHDTYFL